jgi:hypothetical protein
MVPVSVKAGDASTRHLPERCHSMVQFRNQRSSGAEGAKPGPRQLGLLGSAPGIRAVRPGVTVLFTQSEPNGNMSWTLDHHDESRNSRVGPAHPIASRQMALMDAACSVHSKSAGEYHPHNHRQPSAPLPSSRSHTDLSGLFNICKG